MKNIVKLGIGISVLAFGVWTAAFFLERSDVELPASGAQLSEDASPEPSKKTAATKPTLEPSLRGELDAGPTESLPVPALPAEEAEPAPPEEETLSLPRGPFEESEAMRSQETITIDPPMREIGRAWMEDSEQRNDFTMPVSGGRDLAIEVERFEAVGDDGGEFIGKVKGFPDSSVRLSYRGRDEAGTIRLPSENRTYRILPGENGQIIVQDRDLAKDESPPPESTDETQLPPQPDFTPPSPP